ncbi:hypothetical protein ONS95_014362 [Cadophora gregata]|uniref:uncharacterized protein n=1 Tax=Cadophora gregata TaxID=51156 RepID=UPI0026DD547A|nr:uncharacterized protein ONS95_014362 [Cadophora gregata]KAK0112619.1 hypothetical protein ONS95_014362 [Cadophora gregata]KAK0124752.1 hypothetical protein ONS96_008634 [Cadophora gregata f. sp. sojae]
MVENMGAFCHWKSFLSLPLLIIGFISVYRARPQYNPEAVTLHDVLASFTKRGQLAIELFPPLSLVIGSLPNARLLLNIASQIGWIFVGVVYVSRLRVHNTELQSNLSGKAATCFLVIPIIWLSNWTEIEDLLPLQNDIADALLTMSILMTLAYNHTPRWLRILSFLGLGETLIFASCAIGCNSIDSLAAYILIFLTRAMSIGRRIADRNCSAVTIVRNGVLSLSIALIMCPLSSILLHGALLPISESVAGGNYNLRYLSAAARRDITLFPAVRPPSARTAPDFRPRHGTQYTLYVPGAGFFWSDSMMWKQSIPDSIQDYSSPSDEVKQWSVEGSYRVFFQDKFLERYIWEIQELSEMPQSLRKHRKQWKISPGATVRLFDPKATRYLCVIAGEAVVSEAGYFSNVDGEQSLGRIRVGTYPNPMSPHCEWTAYFDSRSDDGIRLYNDESKCGLATTFRSVPDSKLSLGNDTALRVMDLKLEASCNTQASPASSKMFLIESSTLGQGRKSKVSLADKESAIAAVSYWRRGMHYFEARSRLARFRQYHSHLQEEALGTSINALEGETPSLDLSKPEVAICVLYITVWMMRLLVRQRYPDAAAKENWSNALGGLFVFSHIVSYYIFGMKILHSSRVAGMVSLYCLLEYVLQII